MRRNLFWLSDEQVESGSNLTCRRTAVSNEPMIAASSAALCIDDRRQNASQQPVWFKSVDNIEHADRNKSDDKDVEKFHTPPPLAMR